MTSSERAELTAASRLIPRHLAGPIAEALSDTPVVLLAGPRQSGKTTLARQFAEDGRSYVTLDDDVALLAARDDPVGTIRRLDRAVIDEVQRAPGLLLAIKKSVDEDRRPGRFLLTGSANLMTLPTVAESLAGRTEMLYLLPLAGSEIDGGSGRWLDSVFAGHIPAARAPRLGDALVDRVLRGGYPEAAQRDTARRRTAWARQYVEALIQRDVRDIAAVEKIPALRRLLFALAEVAGQPANYNSLGGPLGLDQKTVARYAGIFEQMFLLQRVPPWSANRLSRLVKTPKTHFFDSGLLATLAGIGESVAGTDRSAFGRLLECYVFGELAKQATWAGTPYSICHYRDRDQNEVDFVIENAQRQIIGIEVKAAASVAARDLRGLKKLASLAGDRFVAGIVLHDGSETLPVGDRLWVASISSLWN